MSTAPHAILDHLQDPEKFRALDPFDMMGLVLKFPQQCRKALAIPFLSSRETPTQPEIRQVVLTGLGGSAIGGDFARGYLEAYGTVPLIVNRDYTLPHWAGPQTLVIAASYSGNTEETLGLMPLPERPERSRPSLPAAARWPGWRRRTECLWRRFRADSRRARRPAICFFPCSRCSQSADC